jgi:hypothetical protein
VNVTVTEGEPVLLSVEVSGTGPFAYQWRKDGEPIEGATSASLELADPRPFDSGGYDVEVSNFSGSVVSAAAVVTVKAVVIAPTIRDNPADAAVTEGEPVVLSVSARGSAPFAYQWRKDGEPIDGATEGRLELTAAALGDSGSYDVVVSNEAGSAVSAAATVTVYPLPGVDTDLIMADGTLQEQLVQVSALDPVSWTATTEAEWIRIPSGFAGQGDGTVRLVLLANDTGVSRDAIVRIGGTDVTVLQGFLPPPPPPPEGFEGVVNAVPLGGDAYLSPWFGQYTHSGDDWITHSELGLLRAVTVEEVEGMYLYSVALGGWVWTSEGVFGYLYAFDDGAWVTYFLVDGKNGLLYDATNGAWSRL